MVDLRTEEHKKLLDLWIDRLDNPVYFPSSKENIYYIKELVKHQKAKGLSVTRILKYLLFFRYLFIIVEEKNLKFDIALGKPNPIKTSKDIVENAKNDELMKEQLKTLMTEVRAKYDNPETLKDFSSILKHSFKIWFGDDQEYPKYTAWLKCSVKKSDQKKSEAWIQEEEVEKMINATDDLQEKAIVAVLYESCCRPNEILSSLIADYNTKNPKYVEVSIAGNKGSRDIMLFDSKIYLKKWLAAHPRPQQNNSYLFYDREKNRPFDTLQLGRILQRLAAKADVKTRVNPYNFRKSGISNKLVKGFGQELTEKYSGHLPGSRHLKAYDKTTLAQYKDRLFEIHGIETAKEKKKKELEKICINCNTINGYADKVCSQCGFDLSKTAKDILEEKNNEKKANDELNNRLALIERKLRILDRYEKLKKS